MCTLLLLLFFVLSDVSNPTAPVVVGLSSVGARDHNAEYVLRKLCVVLRGSSNAFVVFDISNPAAPQKCGRVGFATDALGYLAVQGRYVYVAVSNILPSNGLLVVDIADPKNPTIVGTRFR